MLIVPGLDHEWRLWLRGQARVVGADEVGIGSLAGPVVAAAVRFSCHRAPIPGVRDSKALSASQRAALLPEILAAASAIGIGAASVAEIERLNVLQASRLALRRAIRRAGPSDHRLIDGRQFNDPLLDPHTEIVDGDAICYTIACASIVAKVVRDRLMAKLAARFPEYGWTTNAGYGTSAHLAALRRHGVTAYHRLGFGPVRTIRDDELAVEIRRREHRPHAP